MLFKVPLSFLPRQIFNIEGPSTAAETAFQVQFARLTRELSESDSGAPSPDKSARSFGQPGLRALAKVSAIEASPQAVLEEFLSLDDASRPRIHAPRLEGGERSALLDSSVQDAALLIDFGLHSARQAKTLANILEVAKRKLVLATEGFRRAANGEPAREESSGSSPPVPASFGRAQQLSGLVHFVETVLELLRSGGRTAPAEQAENAFLESSLVFPPTEEARSLSLATLGLISSAMKKFREASPGNMAVELEELMSCKCVDQMKAKSFLEESLMVKSFKKIDSVIRRSTTNVSSSLLQIMKM